MHLLRSSKMSLVKYTWTYSAPQILAGTSMQLILKNWHRASLLWMELSSLSIGGKPCSEDGVERLNLWLRAGGAWKCTLLPHFESERVIREILRHGGLPMNGSSSA